MPTYDYACGNCGQEFEQSQKMSDPPLKVCPLCDEEALKRIIKSPPSIIFKGTGWTPKHYGVSK